MRLLSRSFLILALLALLSGCGYNPIQQKDETVKAGWSEVLNQYKRRADLIPNLVKTVQGYAQQERQVLTDVTNARARVGQINVNADDVESLKNFQAAQGELSSALSRLLVVTENYPNLKADQSFRDLQAQLEGTENRITVARGRYITTVQDYNTYVRSFPQNLTAMMFGYKQKPNFTVENEAQISEAPGGGLRYRPASAGRARTARAARAAAAGTWQLIARDSRSHMLRRALALVFLLLCLPARMGTAGSCDPGIDLAGGRHHRHAGCATEAATRTTGAGPAATQGQPAAGADGREHATGNDRAIHRSACSTSGSSAARASTMRCCWSWPRTTGACASSRVTGWKARSRTPSPTASSRNTWRRNSAQGDYGGGIADATAQLVKLVDGEALPAPVSDNRGAQGDGGGDWIFALVAAFIAASFIRGLFGKAPKGVRGLFTGGAAGGVAWLMSSLLPLAGVAGVIGLLYGLMSVSAGRYARHGGWGGFGGGGWGGGGFGGGGGGFGGGGGGWSGGGGMSGGGGASGSW